MTILTSSSATAADDPFPTLTFLFTYCENMESVLQLCETINAYPEHFEKFLNNCVNEFPENFMANDYLFAAVYFIILEVGFTPTDLTQDDDSFSESVTFDIRKLRAVLKYHEDQLKLMKNCKPPKCHIYKIPVQLGSYSLSKCEIQGVPSSELDTHLILNFLSKDPSSVRSLCLNTEQFTTTEAIKGPHNVKLKNLKELSFLVKNKVATFVKDLILLNEEEGCIPNLLRLPEDIQTNILNNLSNDAASVMSLGSSCSYFYYRICSDTRLWEDLCFSEFKGQDLAEATNEVLDLYNSRDINLFREIFLMLKKKGTAKKLIR